MRDRFMMTSESVTEGHPDKLCDQISDAIVDDYLRQDPSAQLVAECSMSTGIVMIAVKHQASDVSVDVADVARTVIRQVGYTPDVFDVDGCAVMTSLHPFPPNGRLQTKDERDLDEEELNRLTAKHQTSVFGFACTQTAALMPLPISLGHKLSRRLAEVRRSGDLEYLAPDGETQVGVEYEGTRARRIHSLTLIAAQREERHPKPAVLERDLLDHVVTPIFEDERIRPDSNTRIAINPEGKVVPGGPSLHAGLTGRKNGVDTYGAFARHSSAALSGKDPSRIDRTGAYAARYAAKNVVAAGLAEQCEICLSYSIGLAGPVSIQVETFGTGKLSDDEIAQRVENVFDFRVGAIVRNLRLRDLSCRHPSGIFRRLATYGHVGRMDLDLPWERTDRVDELR